MITPRQTRLIRVPSLGGLQNALTELVATLDAITAADTFVVVPTRAAGEQLRRTLEDRLLPSRGVIVWPHVGPRADLYREIASRTALAPTLLSGFDREVLLGRVAREVAESGLEPPFGLRPALVAEMLALYDHIRRQARSVEDFDRNLRAELEPAADTDRGAAQLLTQTRFLAAAFGAYEGWLSAHALSDEHGLRAAALQAEASRPLRHVIVAVADRVADADGLWPVDFRLLSMIPGLARLDLIATEALLASGYLERVHAALPGLEEVAPSSEDEWGGDRLGLPALVAPAGDAMVASARDREEELVAVARRIKAERRAGSATALSRQALIVRRPLPYLYLVRSVFGAAGIPFEALDTLPLAAEPYAAVLDLVLDAASSGFARVPLVGLLRTPHLTFAALADGLAGESVSALDRALAEARYLGGLDRLTSLASSWAGATADRGREGRRQRRAIPALEVAIGLAKELSPLGERRPVPQQIELVQSFLARYHREAGPDVDLQRAARVRAAVWDALDALGRAHAAYDPTTEASALDLSSTIRRWLGAQTFAARSGSAGVRLLDARAARFADIDEAQLLGLVEGEWPEPVKRSIFYPPVLLGLLEPAPAEDPNRRESETMAAARASFNDLLALARHRVRVSRFALESDAVVEPSPLVDDLGALGHAVEIEPGHAPAAVFADEALLWVPPELERASPYTRAWAAARARGPIEGDRRYLGEAGPWRMPRVSVSRIDRYLKCPFQFFASEVLRLEEEPEDGDRPPPWERGRFLHAIFEEFFREWQERGHRGISPDHVADARALLVDICERQLATLPAHEAALERPRLHGSAVSAGIIDRVLSMEAERPAAVLGRLIEFELDAPFVFREAGATATRRVPLRAKVDRIDLLDDGRFRVVDYKSKFVPDLKRSVQLQVYTSAVAQQLDRDGDPRLPAEAVYLSLEGDTPVRALRPAKGQSLDDLLRQAEERMLGAIDDIAAGHFPARPVPRSLCAQCPFDGVCRKAFVEPDA